MGRYVERDPGGVRYTAAAATAATDTATDTATATFNSKNIIKYYQYILC